MTSDAGHWLRTKGHATYVADAHPESERWATWACCWVAGDAVPLEVDLSRVRWRTVTDRAEIDGSIGRTHFLWGGECTVRIYSGLEGCESANPGWTWRETIRHELVHVWQHQHWHKGHQYVERDGVPVVVEYPEGSGLNPGTAPPISCGAMCLRWLRRAAASSGPLRARRYIYLC